MGKIDIICKIHGDFEQTPNRHLVGQGCNKCGIILTANKNRKTLEEFIEKSNKIHGNEEEGEEIKLHFIPMSTLKSTGLKQIKDAKTEVAIHRSCAWPNFDA